jgi:hypothetical protein
MAAVSVAALRARYSDTVFSGQTSGPRTGGPLQQGWTVMSQVKESTGSKSASTAPTNRMKEVAEGIRREDHRAAQGGDLTAPIGRGENALHVGIDLGTSRTSASASNGARHTVLSWLGY